MGCPWGVQGETRGGPGRVWEGVLRVPQDPTPIRHRVPKVVKNVELSSKTARTGSRPADAAPPSGHYSGLYLLTTIRTLSCETTVRELIFLSQFVGITSELRRILGITSELRRDYVGITSEPHFV